MLKRLILTIALGAASSVFVPPVYAQQSASAPARYQYKILATNRVASMESEMNDAAAEGYAFQEAVSGETSFGGNETIVIMSRVASAAPKPRYQYKLLATSKTSTLQKEMQEAGSAGYAHRDETVFKKVFGTEVTAILERDLNNPSVAYDYKLLATSKTSTMQKEVSAAAEEGYEFVGVTNGGTTFGGKEVVTIMRRQRTK